jgi:hypothetical protein
VDVFVDTITRLPTAIFTVLLVIAMLYWTLVIVVGLDVDALGGGAEGALEAGDGALEALDGAEGIDSAAGSEGGLLAVLSWFGVRRMPLSVTLSVVVLAAWIVSYLGTKLALPALASLLPSGLAVGLVGFGALVAAMPVTALASIPLEPLFRLHRAESNRDLIGKMCRVRTGTVTEAEGAAVVVDGTAGDVIQVRCRPGQLTRGQLALIVYYDAELNAFQVEPMPEG